MSLKFVFACCILFGIGVKAAPLNSSIIMFSQQDFDSCPQKVDQAIALGNKKILFLPTLYYEGKNKKIDCFCSMDLNGCNLISVAVIQKYRQSWVKCFHHAAELGADLEILPHIDDDLKNGYTWRNEISFDPLSPYKGYSYVDIMLSPLLGALQEAVGSSTHVEISLQGEMGASIFHAPGSYLKIANQFRKIQPTWKVGISLNHNEVDGLQKNSHPKEMQSLINYLDFIGISAYHKVKVLVDKDDFLLTIKDFKSELEGFGVFISADKSIQFSEIGIGGGTNQEPLGTRPASSVQEAAETPWSGIYIGYSLNVDPWQISDLRDLRVRFHRALLDFLDLPVADTHVSGAFLWNENSWDVQGLYEPRYADPTVIQMIKNHNLKF